MTSSEQADAEALGQAKRMLRQAVGIRRKARAEERRTADDTARTQLVKDALVQGDRPTSVALYLSAAPEPGTLELVAWLSSVNVPVLLPLLAPNATADGGLGEPDWAPYGGHDRLHEGPFAIIEPTTDAVGAGALRDVPVVIVPGLAATTGGDRLGRGGGWYDRALVHGSARTQAWVLLNDDEVMEVVPVLAWDVPVQKIITPTRVISC